MHFTKGQTHFSYASFWTKSTLSLTRHSTASLTTLFVCQTITKPDWGRAKNYLFCGIRAFLFSVRGRFLPRRLRSVPDLLWVPGTPRIWHLIRRMRYWMLCGSIRIRKLVPRFGESLSTLLPAKTLTRRMATSTWPHYSAIIAQPVDHTPPPPSALLNPRCHCSHLP